MTEHGLNGAGDLLDATEAALGDHLGPVTFMPGAVILREGDRGGCAYLVEHGQVRITKRSTSGEEREIAILGEGELFGEMAPIDEGVRSATATALTQVDLVPISRPHLDELVERADPLLNLMLRALFGRLREMQNQIAGRPHGAGTDIGWDPGPAGDLYEEARQSAGKQIRLERALSDALRRREFTLHYQPIVSLADIRVEGFEALIRWMRPDLGMIPPGDFVHTAERTGLIVPIGLWVIEHAAHALERLRAAVRAAGRCDRDLFMTVNVSTRQLRNLSDVEAICSVIRRCGTDPARLKLEITENLLVDNPDVALEGIERFRELGAQVAIDDFGTGYSSLSYLHRFPLDTLKIDRSFVSSMLFREQTFKLMRSIVGLADGLGLDVVAEGVEREAEADALKQMGCRYGQGYLYSAPVVLRAAEHLVVTPLADPPAAVSAVGGEPDVGAARAGAVSPAPAAG